MSDVSTFHYRCAEYSTSDCRTAFELNYFLTWRRFAPTRFPWSGH